MEEEEKRPPASPAAGPNPAPSRRVAFLQPCHLTGGRRRVTASRAHRGGLPALPDVSHRHRIVTHPGTTVGPHPRETPPSPPLIPRGRQQLGRAEPPRGQLWHGALPPAPRSRRFRVPPSQGWQTPRGGGGFAQEGRGWQAGSARGSSRHVGHGDANAGMPGAGHGGGCDAEAAPGEVQKIPVSERSWETLPAPSSSSGSRRRTLPTPG